MRRFLTALAVVTFTVSMVINVAILTDWYVNDGTPNQLKLDHCKVELTEAKEEILDWEDECLDVWDELIHEREQMDRCREGEEICHEYCLCPWTLQPLLPGHEYDEPKYD